MFWEAATGPCALLWAGQWAGTASRSSFPTTPLLDALWSPGALPAGHIVLM